MQVRHGVAEGLVVRLHRPVVALEGQVAALALTRSSVAKSPAWIYVRRRP
jgi:hypothetical protein